VFRVRKMARLKQAAVELAEEEAEAELRAKVRGASTSDRKHSRRSTAHGGKAD